MMNRKWIDDVLLTDS